ncbi:type II secretion system protein E [Actinoplanes sp. SE50]|uniref:GspE/PulE family protein n=1 Tax=unclassified Actinoplanes TaxID=2626549 RepID=UPI00023ECA7C|nr:MULTISPECIES: ATPase, T2SS/T4P/T4SS family [unclassified Actinoplanes]AEV82026.1 General secretion pathway protein E [Actinoplanes sp. SE50/110]ATO80425.1 type II secretion system protein E [Actinoplanes sp. SE50]SLL97832.1 type II secretion system protein E [Actinoplanes sp. SE50/110]
MDQTFRPLLDALKQIGVDPHAVDSAAEEAQRSGRPVRAVLINDQVVTEEQLTQAAAAAFGINTLDLVGFTPDPTALKRIPLPVVLRHRVLGLAINDGELVVGVTDPADVVALDDVRAATGMTVRPVVVARSEVRRIIEKLQRDDSDLGDLAGAGMDDSAGMAAQQTSTEDAPIVRYVNSLIEQAVMNRASDLHLEPTEDEMRVRYRIDGVLHEVDIVPRGVMAALTSRIKIMSGVDITEKRVPQNGRITALIRDRTVDLRTATLPTVWGEKIVLRVLDTGGIDLDLRKLGFTEHNLSRFEASFTKPHGMVLVTGPTGSGKSTTLYATLGRISKPEVNVITIEDPVEYRLRGINQVQVNVKAGLTFAAVLPAILRSDPDVVLIGEIRDGTTAQIAVEAALTGHLLLSTLHTNDAPGAVTRLTEMGIEPFLVGSSLDCVLAQRLARRLCDWCKEAYAPTEEEVLGARWPLEDLAFPQVLYRPVGCRNCANTGYKGRIALHEVMPVSPEIESLTIRRAPAGELREVALAQGMYDLRSDGLAKAAGGLTSIREVSRVAV